MNKTITVETIVNNTIDKVWESWNDPEAINTWAHASDDWECTNAKNDLKVGGRFSYTMGAKDKSTSFVMSGVYTIVEPMTRIAYTMEDGRVVEITFTETDGGVKVAETFDMEHENTEELQRSGWQAILDNFKSYAENNK